jgi:hypothetical protein
VRGSPSPQNGNGLHESDAVSEDVPSYFSDRGAGRGRHCIAEYRDPANGMAIAFEAEHATATLAAHRAPEEFLISSRSLMRG